jgi:radical SAM superfamily enzyme YgiQ (UPF0313 family)
MALNIYIADLRHNYQGNLTSDAMPLGIGFIKAFMDIRLSNKVNSSLYATPDELEEKIHQTLPDILMLTNYVWNERLGHIFAKYVKHIKSDCLVIMGGPNISIDDYKKKKYLDEHSYIDIYVTGQGDFLATEIVEMFIAANLSIDKLLKNEIHSSVYRRNGEIVITPILPRSRCLDDIPSPYLSGIMDKFFTGKYAPMIETNRGCPFTCTFCAQGTKWYTKVNYFSVERVKNEIEYIAKLIFKNCPQQKVLRIADPNYGMFERDIEISEHLGRMQKSYNWPLLIDATTGKNKADRIIESIEKVSGALVMYQAVQSLNEEVLTNIKRQNISLKAYEDIQIHVKARGLKSNSDLIYALPGESFETHLSSLKKIINSGTNRVTTFQAMILKGSELETDSQRKQFSLQTKFRILPKAFGEYLGEKVFDVEEIIVTNNSADMADYLKARIYHFGINIFWNNDRFEYLIKFCNHIGISNWEWLENIIHKLLLQKNFISDLLNLYIKETENELFETKEEIEKFYSEEINFSKLITGEIGDNLIYKYKGITNFFHWSQICKIVFEETCELIKMKGHHKPLDVLFDLEKFTLNSFTSGQTQSDLFNEVKIELNYDLISWVKECNPDLIEKYKLDCKTQMNFRLSTENKKTLVGALQIWGYDSKSIAMLTRRIHPDTLKTEMVSLE